MTGTRRKPTTSATRGPRTSTTGGPRTSTTGGPRTSTGRGIRASTVRGDRASTAVNLRAPAALGLRALRGGAAIVAVTADHNEPRVVFSSFLATSVEDDRLTFEPYHVAAEMCPDGNVSAEAETAVAEGRKRQDDLAVQSLKHSLDRLRAEMCEPSAAALLVNRAGWITDLLSYSIAFADHPPVAEGLAVRDALRFACRHSNLVVHEVDEKSLPDLAAEVFRLSTAAIDARLKALGADAGKPWRKEQKLACLAAWVTLAKAR